MISESRLVGAVLRDVIVRALARKGYRVLEAENGVEALRMVEQYADTIHLMVTDILMPRMGGIELVKRMSEIKPDVAVLLISGHHEEGVTENAHTSKALPMLRKPFRTKDLIDTVNNMLSEQARALTS